jgi:hypothetical protein
MGVGRMPVGKKCLGWSGRRSDQLFGDFVLRCFYLREEKDSGGGAAAASNVDRY